MITLLLSLALGFEEVCAGPYDNAQFRTDLQQVDRAFAELNVEGARAQISGVHRKLLCLGERVDPHGVARFSRQLSLAFFFDQDEAAMRRWARASRVLDPELPWYADMAEDHPFRELFADVDLPEQAGPDAALLLPKNAVVFWNGLARDTPTAPIETPGLVQLADRKDSWLRLWWQDGSAYPDEYLGPAGPPVELPKWVEAPPSMPGFAEDAALPLFGEAEIAMDKLAVADAAPVAEPEEPPGAYIDPFEDARRRAVRRETFESHSTNEAGDAVTILTEVVTLARDDRSEGRPVTYEVFQYWLEDMPTWKQVAARDAGWVGPDYLADWVDSRPPKGTARSPLVWVSASAAKAYCESFGSRLPPADRSFGDQATWEWRTDGAVVVRVSAKGKAKKVDDPTSARDDTGFRCARS